MHHPLKTVIGLLFLAAPLIAGHDAAGALESKDLRAVQILAGARAVNARCGVLNSEESAELARYAARAEIAAAAKISAKAASNAVAIGEADSAEMQCTPELAADLRDTLLAAREAVSGAQASQPVKVETGAAKSGKESLEAYRRMVGGYYIERKCLFLTAAQDRRFWKAIARHHRSAVAKNGASAVAPVMQGAEKAANRKACNAGARELVESAYAESLSR